MRSGADEFYNRYLSFGLPASNIKYLKAIVPEKLIHRIFIFSTPGKSLFRQEPPSRYILLHSDARHLLSIPPSCLYGRQPWMNNNRDKYIPYPGNNFYPLV